MQGPLLKSHLIMAKFEDDLLPFSLSMVNFFFFIRIYIAESELSTPEVIDELAKSANGF
jgi:hypothetical protein